MIRTSGFKFNEVHVKNTYTADSKYFLLGIKESVSPQRSYKVVKIPGRNGDLKIKGGYESKKLVVTVGVFGANSIERDINKRLLLEGWLDKKDKLIFDDSPQLFYEAEILDSIEQSEGELFNELSIPFECSPFKYELYGDASDYIIDSLQGVTIDSLDGVLINTREWTIVPGTTKPITNKGNFETNAVISIRGVASLVSITLGSTAFTFNNLLDEEVVIDTERKIVYKIVNGKKVSRLANFIGAFPVVPKGDSTLSVSGNFSSINLKMENRNTYRI